MLTYFHYLLETPLNALLEGSNTKFKRFLRYVDNNRQGINTQKTEIKTLTTTILPRPTGKGPTKLPRATSAQVAAIATPPSLRAKMTSTPGMTF